MSKNYFDTTANIQIYSNTEKTQAWILTTLQKELTTIKHMASFLEEDGTLRHDTLFFSESDHLETFRRFPSGTPHYKTIENDDEINYYLQPIANLKLDNSKREIIEKAKEFLDEKLDYLMIEMNPINIQQRKSIRLPDQTFFTQYKKELKNQIIDTVEDKGMRRGNLRKGVSYASGKSYREF